MGITSWISSTNLNPLQYRNNFLTKVAHGHGNHLLSNPAFPWSFGVKLNTDFALQWKGPETVNFTSIVFAKDRPRSNPILRLIRVPPPAAHTTSELINCPPFCFLSLGSFAVKTISGGLCFHIFLTTLFINTFTLKLIRIGTSLLNAGLSNPWVYIYHRKLNVVS